MVVYYRLGHAGLISSTACPSLMRAVHHEPMLWHRLVHARNKQHHGHTPPGLHHKPRGSNPRQTTYVQDLWLKDPTNASPKNPTFDRNALGIAGWPSKRRLFCLVLEGVLMLSGRAKLRFMTSQIPCTRGQPADLHSGHRRDDVFRDMAAGMLAAWLITSNGLSRMLDAQGRY